MPRWRIGAPELVSTHSVFSVRKHEISGAGSPRTIHTLETSDWCNIVPVTESGEIVMVRQHRFGIDAVSLEIPGGIVDAGEVPMDAAARELTEETGFEAGEVAPLGVVRANPAIQATRLHMFLARGCRPHGRGQALEELEDCEVVLLSRADLDRELDRTTRGEPGAVVVHALVWAALFAWGRFEARELAAGGGGPR